MYNPRQERSNAVALAHITLATRDATRSAAFFHAVMGWTPIGRPNNNAMPTSWLEIAPGQELHLVEVPDFEPSPFEQEYGRHIAVSVPRASFASLQQRLVSHGCEIIEPLRDTPFARFFFRDPNGYLFEVLEEERGKEPLVK
jgi:catechol 2,3-dioxygenase-like lactoylglutathione lyase family enzyme